MSDELKNLNENDVISVEDRIFDAGLTLKYSQVIREYSKDIHDHISQSKADIFEKGIKCEVLRVGGEKWRKGKIKFVLKFEPDESE